MIINQFFLNIILKKSSTLDSRSDFALGRETLCWSLMIKQFYFNLNKVFFLKLRLRTFFSKKPFGLVLPAIAVCGDYQRIDKILMIGLIDNYKPRQVCMLGHSQRIIAFSNSGLLPLRPKWIAPFINTANRMTEIEEERKVILLMRDTWPTLAEYIFYQFVSKFKFKRKCMQKVTVQS